MNLDYTKHQQKIEMVHKKLVDEEEEFANAVKAHEKQGHNVLMCTIVIVVLLVITAIFRMMDAEGMQYVKENGGNICADLSSREAVQVQEVLDAVDAVINSEGETAYFHFKPETGGMYLFYSSAVCGLFLSKIW